MLWGVIHPRPRCYYICWSVKQRMAADFIAAGSIKVKVFSWLWFWMHMEMVLWVQTDWNSLVKSLESFASYIWKYVAHNGFGWVSRHTAFIIGQHPWLVTWTPEGSRCLKQRSCFSLRWCCGPQLPSYAAGEGGLRARSTHLSFSFFPSPGAQAVALERQLPWARLRTVRWDGECASVKEQ